MRKILVFLGTLGCLCLVQESMGLGFAACSYQNPNTSNSVPAREKTFYCCSTPKAFAPQTKDPMWVPSGPSSDYKDASAMCGNQGVSPEKNCTEDTQVADVNNAGYDAADYCARVVIEGGEMNYYP